MPRNRILLALPPEDLARLRPALEPVELPLKQTLFAPGEPIEAAWFVESGAVSLLAHMEDGSLVEVGVTGREGMVGMPLVLGADTSSTLALVEMPGTALRLRAPALREALEASPALRRLLLRYALAFHGQVAWTAACNARHVIEQRLARWLLVAHDQMDGDDLPLTHEVLSQMLGVRRQGVTVAAGILQKAGLIRIGRGQVSVLDRTGLEAAACECYGESRREFERLFGHARG
jgi:CRP-like cAMP-binding protein